MLTAWDWNSSRSSNLSANDRKCAIFDREVQCDALFIPPSKKIAKLQLVGVAVAEERSLLNNLSNIRNGFNLTINDQRGQKERLEVDVSWFHVDLGGKSRQ